MSNIKRVSDVISVQDIHNWEDGDVITIKAGTGSGKSYFIKNRLFIHAKDNNKKILMLIHRSNCVDQFQREIEKDRKSKNIVVKTYQSVEEYRKKHNKSFLNKFDYIVCDEFHYFMSDANFNQSTDISLTEILNQKDKVRIFMSATGYYMDQYMREIKSVNPISYKIPINYDYIKSLHFFHQESTLEKLIGGFIKRKEKAIVFVESVQVAYQLHRQFKEHTLFNCSKSNKKHYKHVKSKAIEKMLDDENFNQLILITTRTLEAGVNIVDDQLHNIVVSGMYDTGTIIQCVGRKRIEDNKPNDYINLYIESNSNKKLGGIKGQINRRLQKAEYVRSHGTEKYIKEYMRNTHDTSGVVYDDIIKGEDKAIKRVNEMIYFKNKVDIVEINKMLNLGKFGFCKYIADVFGFYDSQKGWYDYKMVEKEENKSKLERYLDSLIGRQLIKEEQERLVREINLKDSRGRLQKGLKTINGYFNDNQFKYMLISKKTSKRVNGEPQSYTYWEVIGDIEL
ncbi:DEAD/DEAH box helicase [Aquibacillus saliphilus]|uniref:DEAD/DEAH box helicase n=1 Tax=Aquibacillus saliphilus TaxID=1909422 RepID=UPI001CF0CA7E|nr:DEAD/DEAH box helicase family protein [Aquibacillus saliphilus]